jgi:integrase
MARTPKGSLPKYRLHRQSGQAIVTLPQKNGRRRDVLLGKWGTPEAEAEYNRVIAEWLANTRQPPQAKPAPDLTVNELLLRFWEHAEKHYRRPDGAPTGELGCLRSALRPLRQLYGHTLAREFGPLALEAVRNRMVELGWCRRSINTHVSRIKSVFKWAGSKQLVPPSVHHALLTVRGLQRGRSDARETGPVRPVPQAHVEAVLPFAPPQVRDMARLQRLTGMRPGEVVTLRGIDLDTTGPVWLYRPGSDQGPDGAHKTAWRGHERVIPLGPKAQAVLRPWLRTEPAEYLFQPCEAMAARNAERGRKRKTKVQPSRANLAALRKKNPKRQPGRHYTVDSYRQAVARACKKAGVPHFHPHQIRHTAATEIRRLYGLEAAQAVLGHTELGTTQVYAETDQAAARRVMAEIG